MWKFNLHNFKSGLNNVAASFKIFHYFSTFKSQMILKLKILIILNNLFLNDQIDHGHWSSNGAKVQDLY